ncbi:NlpC/P60 family protein [Actinomadura rubrisoli]|uniref:NlpC/P60 family protein n=1 Tax=Actinomadura rubrisoli TaxID=2530368 RepID=A0A4V2YUU8_9ACTN|nr:NlpC/P60 family protein [Actinomadura rubrisoli]TDD79017.1 NlpC/P60 family protein [Actinomadura rubrisoli]
MAPRPAQLRRGTPLSARAGTLRLIAFSSGLAIGMSWLVPAASAGPVARPATRPAPSERDVEKSERQVQERAAEVGRTKARLALADGELDKLAIAAEAAVERYNGERVMLERAQKTYQDTQARVAEAVRRVAESQAELASFAAQVYQHNTGYDQMSSALVGNGGPQGFMDRAGMVKVLAERRAGMVSRVEASKNVAEMFRRQAKTAFEEQGAATRRADDAKRFAEDAVARQQASVQRIEAEKRSLERRLGSAQEHAAQVKRARERALDRALERARERALEATEVGAVSIGPGRPVASAARGALVARAALKWLGTPYSWGGGTVSGPSFGIAHGSGIFGFDCSGLAMYAWAKAGVRLDHWTGTQWTSGPHVPLSALRSGDLVFFARDKSNPDTIHHVGVYIGDGRMVEAPYTGAHVRISSVHRHDLIGATRPTG